MRIAGGGQNVAPNFSTEGCAPVCLDKPGKRRVRLTHFTSATFTHASVEVLTQPVL